MLSTRKTLAKFDFTWCHLLSISFGYQNYTQTFLALFKVRSTENKCRILVPTSTWGMQALPRRYEASPRRECSLSDLIILLLFCLMRTSFCTSVLKELSSNWDCPRWGTNPTTAKRDQQTHNLFYVPMSPTNGRIKSVLNGYRNEHTGTHFSKTPFVPPRRETSLLILL